MTFRAKPVVKRSHKPAWESQDRRNLYLNIGFGVVVALAVLILLIAAGAAVSLIGSGIAVSRYLKV